MQAAMESTPESGALADGDSLAGILRGYRFSLCETTKAVAQALDVRRHVDARWIDNRVQAGECVHLPVDGVRPHGAHRAVRRARPLEHELLTYEFHRPPKALSDHPLHDFFGMRYQEVRLPRHLPELSI